MASLKNLSTGSIRTQVVLFAVVPVLLCIPVILFLFSGDPSRAFGSALALLSISAISGFLADRHIGRPIEAVSAAITNEDKHLVFSVPVESENEIGELAKSINEHMEKLQMLFEGFHDSANLLGVSVAKISSAISAQATVTSEQAASVAEITSTSEELSASASQIAEHAKAVADFASKTWEDTKKGALAIETVLMKMSEIQSDNKSNIDEIIGLGKRSKEISKVMEIINTIADQTKLIAFNASLEASSAGEAGRRFGVVASEIRRLADNVMDSTGEIKGKIGEIQTSINRLVVASEKGSKGIQEGMEYSGEMAALLSGIVEAARSTMDASKQISISTQQQRTATGQVTLALRDFEAGATQTSSAIGQIDSIGRDLISLSETLNEISGSIKE